MEQGYERVLREIKDSGNRTEFATGAVRDIQEGKGRCDLLPLDVVGLYLNDGVMLALNDFIRCGNPSLLLTALDVAVEGGIFKDKPTAMLEVAIHFEEGAKKYGERNWQKGIPVQRYIDSAVRHYLKWLRGDEDEPHDRAFCWNVMAGAWTCIHKPELNDYAEEDIKCFDV